MALPPLTATPVARLPERRESIAETRTGALHAGPGSAFFHDEAAPGTRLPRMTDALADPAFAPVDAFTEPVPPEVLAALQAAHRVMVIGHIATDGDAVGSVLGLSRTLRLLGKEAVGVVDDDLPGQLRTIPGSDELKRYAAAAKGDYNLVVMVDVAQTMRIRAAAEAVASANKVLVIDHHETEPTKASLGMKDSATLTTWIESSADAAALLVAGISDRLLAGRDVSADNRRRVYGPELAGMFTDSGAFSYPGVDRVSLRIFELQQNYGNQLDALEATIHYELPVSAQLLLHAPPDLSGLAASADEKTRALATRARQALDAGSAPRIEPLSGSGRALIIPEAFYEIALEAAHQVDPSVVGADIMGDLKRDLNRLLDDAHPWAVLLYQSAGNTYVSTRSRDAGPAVKLAEALGGGGHDRAAGAVVAAPLADVVGQVHAWADAQVAPAPSAPVAAPLADVVGQTHAWADAHVAPAPSAAVP